MRILLASATILVAASLWAGADAQQEKTDQKPQVETLPQQDDRPAPTAQGMRAPEMTTTETQSVPLSEALRTVWDQPADLQGNPAPAPPPQ